MPEGPDGKTIIIVKKVSGHGGHHGGAWKVAYADFVTAMMALFMVLWLVNSASVTTREAIATYFKRPGVFEKGSGTPVELGGGGILNDTFAPPADSDSQIIPNKKIYKDEEGEEAPAKLGKEQGPDEHAKQQGLAEHAKEQTNFETVAKELQKSVASNKKAVEGFLGTVGVKVDQRGLHLEIMDTQAASMFQVGSSAVLPEAKETLLKIAKILAQLPNPIDIEGHTDATPYRESTKEHYDNWNLSLDRANEARRVLEGTGLQGFQIARIVGYADKRPKVPENALDPSNRRITISMRYTEQAAQALVGTPVTETAPKPVRPEASEEAPKPEAEKPAPEKPAAVKPAEPPVTDTKPIVVPPIEIKPIEKPLDVQSKDDAPRLEEKNEAQRQQDVDKVLQDLKAEQFQSQTGEGKLRIEVGRTMPEGAPLPNGEPSEEAPATTTSPDGSHPGWQDPDKIFGNKNPLAQ